MSYTTPIEEFKNADNHELLHRGKSIMIYTAWKFWVKVTFEEAQGFLTSAKEVDYTDNGTIFIKDIKY